ncbi:unnamed protein product, partial [Arabidopsis halleri]
PFCFSLSLSLSSSSSSLCSALCQSLSPFLLRHWRKVKSLSTSLLRFSSFLRQQRSSELDFSLAIP